MIDTAVAAPASRSSATPDERRHAAQLASVARLSQVALHADVPDQVFAAASGIAAEGLGGDVSCLLELDTPWGEDRFFSGEDLFLDAGGDGEDPSLPPAVSRLAVALPGRSGGMLEVRKAGPNPFSPSERTYLEAVGDVLAGYLDRSSHFQRSGLDTLTGAANRHRLLEQVARSVASDRLAGRLTAVVTLDLDEFKVVNDSLGRGAGDDLLVEVARRLRTAVRPDDLVARVGKDEFAALCPGLESADEARAIAERLQATLGEPFLLGDRLCYLGASIGVAATAGGAPMANASDLLDDAERALHDARIAGGGRIVVFDQAVRKRITDRFELTADLRQAVERGELRLFYQPVVRMRDGETVGAEALVRWEHPTRGLVPPGEFIPLAEQSGLIVSVGAWILEEATTAAAGWPACPDGTPRKVSVNISARQLGDASLVATVAGALARSGLAPSALCLEITESLLMSDAERSASVLRALKDLGVCVSVDDFGTGYSSLARLKEFPLDYLKIDRSFVAGLPDNQNDEAIVTAIVHLAHALGLAVVAEGVETDEQRAALSLLGSEGAQGWLWSPALPEPGFLRWLADQPSATPGPGRISAAGTDMAAPQGAGPGPAGNAPAAPARLRVRDRLSDLLPRGRRLSDGAWRRRHAGILTLLALLTVGLAGAALRWEESAVHAAVEALPAAALTIAAVASRASRRWSSTLATLGLLFVSASYVHLTGGLIEAHFLFFVLLGVVTLYQDWVPYLLFVGFTALHHGIAGVLDPASVFNHPAAVNAPVEWALIHSGFVVAASIANLVAWKANEDFIVRDPLTRLPNRGLLRERLDTALGRGGAAVLFLDLCGFKEVNDGHGHEAGDAVLRVTAGRLRAAVRTSDSVARFGGDEFVVVLPGAGEAHAVEVAARLVAALAEPIALDGAEVRIGASVGVALSGVDGSTAPALLHNADAAMYTAKRSGAGRGSYARYTPAPAAGAAEPVQQVVGEVA